MEMQKVTYLSAESSALGRNEDVLRLCRTVKDLEEAGDYEAARAQMAELWSWNSEPQLEGLDEPAQAEVLLRAGALSGWLASARQVQGGQEAAKDLISRSATIFEELGLTEKVTEARIDLAICYWREGALDEARITLDDALLRLGTIESEQRLRAFLNKAIIEKVSTRYKDALQIHREAAPLFERSNNHALRGKFHNEFATVLKNLGLANHNEERIDQALVEYAAASFHFEEAGHKRFLAAVENNIGFLFVHLRKFAEAHAHLDRARLLFDVLKDQGMIAQVDDTRAQAFLGQGHYKDAEKVARASVRVLERGDERSLLAAALTTYGKALARLGHSPEARATLSRAIEVARNGGDPDSGGLAALCTIEELASHLSEAETIKYYQTAESLLVHSQHPGITSRLGECARILLKPGQFSDALHHNLNGNGSSRLIDFDHNPESLTNWQGCSLEAEVLRYEGNLIKRALEVSGGSVTRAARMLGVTHQGLAFILNGRHSDLLSVRTPVKRRRRSIIRRH